MRREPHKQSSNRLWLEHIVSVLILRQLSRAGAAHYAAPVATPRPNFYSE